MTAKASLLSHVALALRIIFSSELQNCKETGPKEAGGR